MRVKVKLQQPDIKLVYCETCGCICPAESYDGIKHYCPWCHEMVYIIRESYYGDIKWN
jgi:hypothetical protein